MRFADLKNDQYEVAFFDTMFAKEPEADHSRAGKSHNARYFRESMTTDSTTSLKCACKNMREAALAMIQYAKKRDRP